MWYKPFGVGGWLVPDDRAIEKVLVQYVKLRSPSLSTERPLRDAMALAGLVTRCTKALCYVLVLTIVRCC